MKLYKKNRSPSGTALVFIIHNAPASTFFNRLQNMIRIHGSVLNS